MTLFFNLIKFYIDMPNEINEKVNVAKMEIDSGENHALDTLEENDYKLLETLVKRENNLISFLKDSNYDRMERHQFLQEIIDERLKNIFEIIKVQIIHKKIIIKN